MPSREFDETLLSIARLNAAATPDAICSTLIDICSKYGFSSALAGFIPDPHVPKGVAKNSVLLDRWPLEWVQRYFGGGYLDVDPAILAVRTSNSSFLWSDLNPADKAGRRVMDEAGDFGLKAGVTVPLHPVEGGVIGFSLAGERLDLPPRALGIITMLANYAICQTLLLSAQPPPPVLTPRETEVLKWVVAGKTVSEISDILMIAHDTANNHVRSLNCKFGVGTRAMLVAEALRMRFVA